MKTKAHKANHQSSPVSKLGSCSFGFTMMELMIILAIIAMLMVTALLGARGQIAKAQDARRKGDLNKIRTVFEEYYNDHECYPPVDMVENCGSPDLAPYTDRVPCDPSGEPYLYVGIPADSMPAGNTCGGFVLCAMLRNKADPDIEKRSCDPDSGCGWAYGYNYCLVNGTEMTVPVPVP